MKDLVVLVADKNTQFALRGALHWPLTNIGIREIARAPAEGGRALRSKAYP